MPKEEWGTKRLCPHCATRFYDLNNNPMTCPACNSEMTLESLTDGRTKTLVSEKTAAGRDTVEIDDDSDDELDADGGDLDDDLLEDDDDDADVSLDDIADVTTEDDD